jgi:hypothetical protein
MEEKKDLQDNIVITDSVSFEIKVIKDEITSITNVIDGLNKIRTTIIEVLILLLLLCLIPFLLYKDQLANGRIIYASVGVLTFISIFYSLLLSDRGRIIIVKTNDLIENAKKKIEKITLKEIQGKEIHELENVEEIKKKKDEAEIKIDNLDEMKKIIDIDLYLVVSVFCLLISIILTIFNEVTLQQIAYAFFAGGFCFSGTIVILWRNYPNILNILEKELSE